MNCPNLALDFMHFPGLTCSGLGSWVLRKGTDSFGHDICALPRSKQLRQPGAWQAHSPRWVVHLNHLPGPSHSVSWVHCESAVSGLPCVSSGKLISGCNPPGGCQPFRIPEDLVSNWEPAHSLVEDAVSGSLIAPCLPVLAVACLPLCLRRGDRPVCSWLALLWYSLNPLFSEPARLCLRIELFRGKFSLSRFFPPSLSGYPTVWVAISH